MKFIIVNGTLKPSTESNTSVVCEMVKLGFEKLGHECEIVNTAELNYKNSTQDEDDDLRPVIHRMIQPDMSGIIIATPIWWGMFSSHTQALIERLDYIDSWSIDGNDYKPMFGKVFGSIVSGGDEIYNNYQSQKGGHVWTKTNGSFPSSLELIWPWHNDVHDRMQLANTRTDMIAGFNVLEARNPLLDTELVQAWINTKRNLKNPYKYWMKKYMDDHQYPYTMKKVHSWCDPYQPAEWMLTNNDKNLTS